VRPDPPEISLDLRKATVEELITFVFRRRAKGRSAGAKEWYWTTNYRLDVDPQVQIAFMTKLFRRSGRLRRRFSEGQIEDGFWFMIGPGGQEWFRDQLWNRDVPWQHRRACILSIPHLYKGVFRRSVESIDFMLWDLLTEDYRFDNLLPKWKPETNRVRRTMLEALAAQLRLPHLTAQYSALHGLGHIGLPRARKILRTYLGKPRLRSEYRRYAEEALRGKLL